MEYQRIFKRYELKYILSREQKEKVVKAIEHYMALDQYSKITIRNLYFDTPTYRLIRRSIEKPDYKEKLRIRSYKKAEEKSQVFVEIKKKSEGVVYKRRVAMSEKEAMDWLCEGKSIQKGQIISEIEYFMQYYGEMNPVLFLSYDREAYYEKDGGSLRITFDENISCQGDDLSLESNKAGTKILEDDKVIMEIKCNGGIPLWMTDILSENRLYKTSFSKYGTAYKELIYPKIKGDMANE